MKHVFLFGLFFSAALWISCGEKPKTNDAAEDSSSAADKTALIGSTVFSQYCQTCHGSDGKLGLNGAKDLTMSITSKEEVVSQVTNGKGAMMAFAGTLKPDEIEAVADYVLSIRQK